MNKIFEQGTFFLINAVIKNRKSETQRIYLNTVEMKGAACPEKVYDILNKLRKMIKSP